MAPEFPVPLHREFLQGTEGAFLDPLDQPLRPLSPGGLRAGPLRLPYPGKLGVVEEGALGEECHGQSLVHTEISDSNILVM